MPDALRRILSRLWLPDDHPVARLVRHFLVRLARGERDTASSEVDVGAGALLGLLTVPGAITCFMLLDKYSTFLDWYRGRFHQDYYLLIGYSHTTALVETLLERSVARQRSAWFDATAQVNE